MGNLFSTIQQFYDNRGLIENRSGRIIFYAVHQGQNPFLKVYQRVKNIVEEQKILEIIRQVNDVHEVRSQNSSIAGLQNLQYNNGYKLSIMFQDGKIFKNSMQIKSKDDIRFRITNDLSTRNLTYHQLN